MNDELDGTIAPPMANGEVLFDAPWQGRVFGMARALAEAGLYTWDEFRAELIASIGEWDRSPGEDQDYEYYNHFQTALERLLIAKQLVDSDSLRCRVTEFLARPHDHDHTHEP